MAESSMQTTPDYISRRPRRLGALLLTALLVELVVLAYLLRGDPSFMRYLSDLCSGDPKAQRENDRKMLMNKDPRLGTLMRLPDGPNLNTSAISLSSKEALRLLVFTGPCSGCSADILNVWQKEQNEHTNIQIAIVSRDTPENIRAFLKARHYSMPFYSDTYRHCATAFNASWLPRAFAVDRQDRLIWREGAETGNPQKLVIQALNGYRERGDESKR